MKPTDINVLQHHTGYSRVHFLESLQRTGVFERNGQRAVHKPLLILMALARIQAGDIPKLVFPEIEKKLQDLIMEFGKTGRSNAPKAHYPFWYLQSDGFWEVDNAGNLQPRKSKKSAAEPGVTTMREHKVRAGFTSAVHQLFAAEVGLVIIAAQTVLNNAFPDTLHLDIINAVGLDGEFTLPATKRDARFREEVLRAYSYTCVICGYDGRLGKNSIGLEAAHIRWAHFGGPNKVSNGLCMCALHHKLFDMGGITIDPKTWQIVVSKDFNGLGKPARAILEFHGSRIQIPPLRDEVPLHTHFDWHKRQVFRSSDLF